MLLFVVVASLAQPPAHCNNKCHVGKHGLSAIFKGVQDRGCQSYAARVVDEDTARDCGHVELADALLACSFNTQSPPQCYLHKAAGEIYAALSTVTAICYLVPIISRCTDVAAWGPDDANSVAGGGAAG